VVALPMLEAMVSPTKLLAASAAQAKSLHPQRMAFIYVPNGVNMADWTPKETGDTLELPYILQPLQPVQQDLLVLTGLAHDKARPHGDGAGDHARASATFLTGAQARKTGGADIKVGVSVDQIAAQKLGHQTRFPSLELACDHNRQTSCDSGYACAYQSNISWRTPATPMPPEVNPRLLFERLFSTGIFEETGKSRAFRKRYEKSLLDFVLEDARKLKSNLGRTDQAKLEEYLSSVREIERDLEQAEQFAASVPSTEKPSGIPRDFEKHMQLMYDLLALSLQTDSTRIATLMIAFDGSNRPYPNLGISDGHHNLSHHENDAEKKKRIAQINHFHMTQFAKFLQKLKATKEGEGTLLDHSMIVYGSGLSDGNAHNHDNLPVLLAGHGGGAIQSGRHLKVADQTPMSNLFVSMLDSFGSPVERFGDSTGKLPGLL
ncbi:MAG: hypothetical protein JWM68_2789, partial [Verrucomicrobiales bacterium]|nr:hypothetical protein [Verrucomicrobiales bacterium]